MKPTPTKKPAAKALRSTAARKAAQPARKPRPARRKPAERPAAATATNTRPARDNLYEDVLATKTPDPAAQIVQRATAAAFDSVASRRLADQGLRFEPVIIAGVPAKHSRSGAHGELRGWYVNAATGKRLFTVMRLETSFPADDVEVLA